jgi:peptidoglycan/xylan/chitin deacetylase (PgdA/CDA1 family)
MAMAVLAAVVLADGCGSTRGAPRAPRRRAHPLPSNVAPATIAHGVRHSGPRPSHVIRRLLAPGLPIYCGGPRGHEVALTFDDGPGPYTHLALRKLIHAHAGATFFVVGDSMDLYPGFLPRELKVAAVGDHTYTHPELTALPPAAVRWQLSATARKIATQTGERVDLWRPPYELDNATIDRIALRLGLLDILWDVDSQDSLGANYVQIIKNVEGGLHPGAIIEMHENRGQTIRALTTLLPVLHRRHLRSVSVPKLLASDPPSPRQLRRGLRGCGGKGKLHARTSE